MAYDEWSKPKFQWLPWLIVGLLVGTIVMLVATR